MKHYFKALVIFIAAAIVAEGLSSPGFSQSATSQASPSLTTTSLPHSQDSWVVNFKDTDIQAVIRQIAEMTGENYVIPSNVTGKINVISQTPLTKKEVKDLLLSILYVNGFSVTPSGNALVIQPSGDAKKNESLVDKSGKVHGEAFIVRVIPVKYASVNDLMEAVQPLVSDFAVIKHLADANALLVADKADNVEKIAEIVAELDTPEATGIESIKLTKIGVENLMPLLEKIAPRELGEAGKSSVSPIRVVGDERSNSVILRGDADARARLRALIAELDQASDDSMSVQVIPLHNADATKTADILKDMFNGGGASGAAPALIKASSSINALVVHAPPDVIDQIRKVVAQLDMPRPQVMIEAAIVEINDDILDQLGIQFGAGQAAFESDLLSTSLPATGSSSLAASMIPLATSLQQLNVPNGPMVGTGITAVIGSHNRFAAFIQALAANSHANLLSTPSITTINNEEAKILVGQNVPFLTGSFAQATTTSGTVNPFNTIQRQDIGVTLKVTPQIHENNHVLLKVEQEVSSIAPTTVSGASDIITNKRSINTSVLAANGQTIALGGLISDNKNEVKSKVPLLGDIPILGYLFRSTQEEDVKSDLVVFLRPTILAADEDIVADNLRKYGELWELEVGDTKGLPPTPDTVAAAIDNLYTPDLRKPVPLPWLNTK